MSGTRVGVAAASIAFLFACSSSPRAPSALGAPPAARVVATFTGIADPVSGTLTIHPEPSATPGALRVWTEYQDGTPDQGPADTFELVTETVTVGAETYPGPEADGCGAGVTAFRGDMRIRSFFRNQALKNVYVEITDVPAEFTGCQKAAAVPGVSAASGLWAYPDVAAGGAQTAPWRFRFVTSQAFTFHGRIMADLGAPVSAGGPEFDWAPTSLDQARSFQEVGTTLAHFVWNGTTFVNRIASSPAVTFVPTGSPSGSAFQDVPGAAYAPTGSGYFVAAPSGAPLDTALAGDFTVCVMFKPGAPAASDVTKTLFAKGAPAAGVEGFALVQNNSAYMFRYATLADGSPQQGSLWPGDTSSYAYDYLCGGRSSGTLNLEMHGSTDGGMTGSGGSETTSFAGSGAALPLAIGAYPDGSNGSADAGVYEVVLDSRPATFANMEAIVAAAEARGVLSSNALYAYSTSATTYGSYTLPPCAVPPLTEDGTGLLAAGEIVKYRHPLLENTTSTGFCVGAEVVATGDWSAVSGGVLGFDKSGGVWDAGTVYMTVNPFLFYDDGAVTATSDVSGVGGGHVFTACVAPGYPATVTMWVDDVEKTASGGVPGWGVEDFSDQWRTLHIGQGGAAGGAVALTGARIRRVFLCPTSNQASCR